MKFKTAATAASAFLITIVLTACVPGYGPTPRPSSISARTLARLASGASYYLNLQDQGYLGDMERDDLAGSLTLGAPTGASQALVSRSLAVADWTYTLPDGTLVEVVQVTDDNNSPGNSQDDIVTVTRTYRVWDNTTEKIEKIVRPAKPQPSWSGWNNNLLAQTGTVEEFLQGVRVKTGTLAVTWRLAGSVVSVGEIVKEMHWVDRNSVIDRLVINFGDGGTRTTRIYRIRLTPEGDVVVHCFAYEDLEENGAIYTKGVREDGGYFIIRSPRDPLVVEQYTPAGVLSMKNTETASGRSRNAVHEYYDGNGNITRTVRLSFTCRFLGDEVLLTRRTLDDGITTTLIIEENEHGFAVRGDQQSFVVWFVGEGVQIYDSAMNLIAVVTFDEQGGCLVTYPGQDAVLVTL